MRVSKVRKKPAVDIWAVVTAYVKDVAGSLYDEHVVFINELILAQDYKQLSDILRVIRFEYREAFPNQVLRQISAFFKKNDEFTNKTVALETAMTKFLLAEEQCRATNERLYEFFVSSTVPEFSMEIEIMQKWIKRTLGCYGSFRSTLAGNLKMTSGATSTRARRVSQPYRKMGRGIRFTSRAVPYAHDLCTQFGLAIDDCKFRVSDENRISFVPKTWNEYRTIAAESEGNLALQLAFDKFAKRRLAFRGIDLTDQTRNREFALRGSLDGSIATIDLSSASDTTALGAVDLLFPDEWVTFLKDVRSPYYRWDGHLRKYHKLSSMGNGTTFGVETLIFAAACYATGSRDFTVYGDDIALETRYFERVCALLSFLGYTVNLEKSFSAGPFRESCGRDYFKGTNIRPFFVKKSGTVKKSQFAHLINGLAGLTFEGHLWQVLRNLVDAFRPVIVPSGENTTSGVFVNHTIWPKRLLHVNGWSIRYKGMVMCERIRRKHDVKAYLLWMLTRSTTSDLETSVVGTSDSYQRTTWVTWNPRDPEGDHLYRWTLFLLRRKA